MISRQRIIKYAVIALLSVGFIGSLLLVKYYLATKNTQDNTQIVTRLNDIQKQLDTVQKEAQKPQMPVDLRAINQDLNKLIALIKQQKSKDEQTLTELISEDRATLTHKLDALHDVVSALDKKQYSIKYLPASTLPFKVLSIDSIQQVSVATVAYAFKTHPLEQSDTLAGWTVLHIDFGQQRMELENANKERVLFHMEQGEQHG
jgi:septation ring formation regulator EzrA